MSRTLHTNNVLLNHIICFLVGSFGGGQNVTLDGTGFDPTQTSVTICGNTCVIGNQPTPTSLTCETPTYTGNMVIIWFYIDSDKKLSFCISYYIICNIQRLICVFIIIKIRLW